MNIFILDEDPAISVHYYCDEHVRKMIVESAQMLSTAHRVLDLQQDRGYRAQVINKKGRSVKQVILPEYLEEPGMHMVDSRCPYYWVSNENHPCNQWVRECSANYKYLFEVYVALIHEYILRFRKINAATNLADALETLPQGIRIDSKPTSFIQAMPVEYQQENAIEAYRTFYIQDKSRFASWNCGVSAPSWFRL